MASKRRHRRMERHADLRRRLGRRRTLCGKVNAPSEAAAWELADAQQRRFGGQPAARVYRCASGGPYHWTQMATAPQRPALTPAAPVGVVPPCEDFYDEAYWADLLVPA